MEAVRTSETSVYSNESTRHYIPEGCHFRYVIVTGVDVLSYVVPATSFIM
jgi:hypothetical protein